MVSSPQVTLGKNRLDFSDYEQKSSINQAFVFHKISENIFQGKNVEKMHFLPHSPFLDVMCNIISIISMSVS